MLPGSTGRQSVICGDHETMRNRLWLAAAITLATCMAAVAQRGTETINCETASSTPELAWCTEQQLKAADAELNAVYREAIASIKGAGHLNTNQRRDWERAMREAQRHWIAFTAKDCGEVTGWEWYRGTGQGTATLACRLTKTKQRTQELKSRYISR